MTSVSRVRVYAYACYVPVTVYACTYTAVSVRVRAHTNVYGILSHQHCVWRVLCACACLRERTNTRTYQVRVACARMYTLVYGYTRAHTESACCVMGGVVKLRKATLRYTVFMKGL